MRNTNTLAFYRRAERVMKQFHLENENIEEAVKVALLAIPSTAAKRARRSALTGGRALFNNGHSKKLKITLDLSREQRTN